MFNWYQNFKNHIDFFIRSKFKVSRKGFFIENENKELLFKEHCETLQSKAFEKEQYLCQKYDLERLKNNSTIITYLANLSIIDLLENNLDLNIKKEGLKILDIGSKNWFYVEALNSFFKTKNQQSIHLTGIELDAYRVYSSFYSRKDAAEFYMQGIENTIYIAGDFLEHNQKYDYITWFYPFVTDYPLLKWGLPLDYLKPERMLEHAYNSLNDGGHMVIINQNEHEYSIQKELFEKLNIAYRQTGEFKSIVYNTEYSRFVSVVKR